MVKHTAQARRSDRMQHSAVQRTLEQHRAAQHPSTQSCQRHTKEISAQDLVGRPQGSDSAPPMGGQPYPSTSEGTQDSAPTGRVALPG